MKKKLDIILSQIISNKRGNAALAGVGVIVIMLMLFMFGIKGILIAIAFGVGCYIVFRMFSWV